MVALNQNKHKLTFKSVSLYQRLPDTNYGKTFNFQKGRENDELEANPNTIHFEH